MDMTFKLQVFEGPLPLLLHLIEINKIDIYDIPISVITDQYLAYIQEMEIRDMDLTSEFLVMAATLLRIKSKMLLPVEKNEETGEAEDPREELVERLLEYKMFKYIAGCNTKFDFIFADPPYQLENLADIPDLVFDAGILADDGIFVLEHGKTNNFSNHPHFTDMKVYGSVHFSFFK